MQRFLNCMWWNYTIHYSNCSAPHWVDSQREMEEAGGALTLIIGYSSHQARQGIAEKVNRRLITNWLQSTQEVSLVVLVSIKRYGRPVLVHSPKIPTISLISDMNQGQSSWNSCMNQLLKNRGVTWHAYQIIPVQSRWPENLFPVLSGLDMYVQGPSTS